MPADKVYAGLEGVKGKLIVGAGAFRVLVAIAIDKMLCQEPGKAFFTRGHMTLVVRHQGGKPGELAIIHPRNQTPEEEVQGHKPHKKPHLAKI